MTAGHTLDDDPHRQLGVAVDADPDTIRRAYRRLVRALHPDINPDPAAHEAFARITAAYEVLTAGARGPGEEAGDHPAADYDVVDDPARGGHLRAVARRWCQWWRAWQFHARPAHRRPRRARRPRAAGPEAAATQSAAHPAAVPARAPRRLPPSWPTGALGAQLERARLVRPAARLLWWSAPLPSSARARVVAVGGWVLGGAVGIPLLLRLAPAGWHERAGAGLQALWLAAMAIWLLRAAIVAWLLARCTAADLTTWWRHRRLASGEEP